MPLAPTVACHSCSLANQGVCGVLGLGHKGVADDALRSRKFKPRTMISRRGERIDSVAILCAGFAIEYIQLVDGRRQIVSLITPGTALSWALEKATEVSILAVSDARVALIPLDRIADVVARTPGKFADIIKSLEARRYEVCELAADIGRRSAFERVCRLLLRMLRITHATIGENSAIMRVPLKRDERADILGLTSTHLTRVLASLRAEGLVTVRGDVYTLRDIAKLTEAAA